MPAPVADIHVLVASNVDGRDKPGHDEVGSIDGTIIDYDLGAATCQPKRMRAAKTIARTRDDSDASIEPDCHA